MLGRLDSQEAFGFWKPGGLRVSGDGMSARLLSWITLNLQAGFLFGDVERFVILADAS